MTEGVTAGPAVRMWARSELGRRWKALVALGVIAGIAAGLALAAIAGARRTSTAYARWRTATAAPDLKAFYGLGPTDTGPTQPATIVGIGDSAMDFAFMDKQAGFVPPGEFLIQHPEIQHAPNLVVRLKPGTDVAKFHERADAALQ